MHATPVSVVGLPPSREAGLSELRDRSTAPPSMLPQGSAFQLQRTSCGAGRLAPRGGAVAWMTGPFAPPVKRSYSQLAPRSHRRCSCSRTALRDVYTHDKFLQMALSAAECAGLQARGTSRLWPARPCRCMSCPSRRAHAVTASYIQVRAGYCKDLAETLCHSIESENFGRKDRTLLTKLRARLSYVFRCGSATLDSRCEMASRRDHADGRILLSQRRQRQGAVQDAAADCGTHSRQHGRGCPGASLRVT